MGEAVQPSLVQQELVAHIAEWVDQDRAPRLDHVNELCAYLELGDTLQTLL